MWDTWWMDWTDWAHVISVALTAIGTCISAMVIAWVAWSAYSRFTIREIIFEESIIPKMSPLKKDYFKIYIDNKVLYEIKIEFVQFEFIMLDKSVDGFMVLSNCSVDPLGDTQINMIPQPEMYGGPSLEGRLLKDPKIQDVMKIKVKVGTNLGTKTENMPKKEIKKFCEYLDFENNPGHKVATNE